MTIAEQIVQAKEDYDAVYDAGKKSEYDEFWANMYPDLNEVGGTYTFAGRSWNDYTFNPPQVITLKGGCNNCFYNSAVTDISKKVAFKNVTSISSAFQFANTKVIGNIDVTTLTTPRLTSTFANSKVVKIGVLKVVENTTYPNTFDGCTALEDIRFYGVIGNNLSFKDSPLLSLESLQSIVFALKDCYHQEDEWTHTLTISKASKDKLDEEMASGGWDYALRYIQEKTWNLTVV